MTDNFELLSFCENKMWNNAVNNKNHTKIMTLQTLFSNEKEFNVNTLKNYTQSVKHIWMDH